MEKVIRDGKVAVVYSPTGMYWYTFNEQNANYTELLFHPKIIEMVENNEYYKITNDFLKNELGLTNIYKHTKGHRSLTIDWIPLGEKFKIVVDSSGAEYLVLESDLNLIA